MNRKDLPLILLLVALILAWPVIYPRLFPPRIDPEAPPTPAVDPTERPDPVAPPDLRPPVPDPDPEPPTVPPVDPAPPVEPAPEGEPPAGTPEERVTLRSAEIEVTLTSHGAGILEVRLLDYPKSRETPDEPVVLDFNGNPALAYEDLPGFGAPHPFEVEVDPDGRRAVFRRRTDAGLALTRTFTLTETGYVVDVEDAFLNEGDAAAMLPAHRIATGPMRALPGETAVRGITYLGIDTLAAGARPDHWGRRLPNLFGPQPRGCATRPPPGTPQPPVEVDAPLPPGTPGHPVDWATAKNKYFVQILHPRFGADAAEARVRRVVDPREEDDPAFHPGRVQVEEVAVALRFERTLLEPGEADRERTLRYYAGPKKLDQLSALGHHLPAVMEFGFWSPISRILLRLLTAFHAVVRNYGLAIILLTLLIRVVFWPITHKSTQSQRKMQEIQPLIQEVRKKYKDNPQRQQREMMALYKEHKINPLGACLPMLIQIPVFIALFVVLRSAIELRFAPFLWIRDLSEPENLLHGRLFGFSLNILPLVMTAAQYAHQKLTPQGGDPQQQRMMMMMPFIMLVFFYSFASGLVLYWTTNQFLMLGQQLLHRRRTQAKSGG